ncbi:MAG: hypothetical protein Q4E65_07875 [Clostridia bacterium]|nr:hypothetical protein [Clostridia bacterium]
MALLEYLRKDMHLHYISDLRDAQNRMHLCTVIRRIPHGQYALSEWHMLACYVANDATLHFSGEEEARAYLEKTL